MKRQKHFSFLVLLFIFQMSFAGEYPTDKGSIMFMGNFSFSSQGGDLYESNNSRLLTIQTNPGVNYFIFPGFSAGIKSLYSYLSTGDNSITTWGIGPSVYYYINGSLKPETAIKHLTYPFPYITASYFYTNNSDTDTKGNTVNLGLGLLALVDDYVGINLEISYDYDVFDVSSTSYNGNKVNFAIGINLFQY